MTELGYMNYGLPLHLNVDNDDMNWPKVSVERQSIDEEFDSYDHSKYTSLDQDLLLHWEVSSPHFLAYVKQQTQCYIAT
jgi:hypothetical protein